MTKTTNYNLNQWEAEDVIKREDFNADNAAIDAALKAVATTASTASTAAAACGNCQLYYLARTGAGGLGQINIAIPKGRPRFLMVATSDISQVMIACSDMSKPITFGSFSEAPSVYFQTKYVIWNSNKVADRLDVAGKTYHVLVLSEIT